MILYLGLTHLPLPDTYIILLGGRRGECEICLNVPWGGFTFITSIYFIFNISHFQVEYQA